MRREYTDECANLAFADALVSEADNPESPFYSKLDGFLTTGAQLDINSRDYVRPRVYDALARDVLKAYSALPAWKNLWKICNDRERRLMVCDAYWQAVGAGVGFWAREDEYPDPDLAKALGEVRHIRTENELLPFVRRQVARRRR